MLLFFLFHALKQNVALKILETKCIIIFVVTSYRLHVYTDCLVELSR
jgi:hypothetical protein